MLKNNNFNVYIILFFIKCMISVTVEHNENSIYSINVYWTSSICNILWSESTKCSQSMVLKSHAHMAKYSYLIFPR